MTKSVSTQRPSTLTRSPLSRSLFARPVFEDFFDRLLSESNGSQLSEMVNTAMDVSENDQAFEVKLDLPGVKADDVEIQMDNQTLMIRGKREEESETNDESKQYHRIERSTGAFSRSVVLPSAINEDETVAEYRDGVLTVTIPKADDAKPRRISIKS